MHMTYDVFISYRRTAFEAANLLSTHLKSKGYNVFFDLEEMNQGKFNEQIIDRIKECKDFIIVLPANALDRCVDEGDWVRREILCAIENGKNIIPLMLEGFVWPTPMPQGLESLSLYQAVTPVPITYYDSQVKKVQSYLLSKPHKRYKKVVITIACVLAALIASLLCVEEMIYRPTADKIARSFTAKLVCIDSSVDAINKTNKHWQEYMQTYAQGNQGELEQLSLSMLKLIHEDSIFFERNKISAQYTELDISPTQALVLSWRGIETTEVEAFAQYEDMFYYHLMVVNQRLKEAIENRDNRKQYNICRYEVETNYVIAGGVAEVMSYGYQYDLSLLTKQAQSHYYNMAYRWKSLPMRATLNLTKEESLTLQNQVMNTIETAVITYEVRMREFND